MANQNFRKTQSGIALGKALFSGKKVNPSQITSLLKSAGVPVPQEALVTADVAQIIMAGGAITTDIAAGASIGAYVNPSAACINGAVSLLEHTGLMNANDPGAQLLKMGTETALVISSCGLNVIADLALVMDLYSQFSKKMPDLTAKLQGMSDNLAKSSVMNYINKIYSREAVTSARLFSQLQTGKISVFEMVGTLADSDPYTFYNYFPDSKSFFPPSFVTVTASGSISYDQQGGAFGLSEQSYKVSSTFSQRMDFVRKMGLEARILGVIDFFLKYKTSMIAFQIMNQENMSAKKISVGDMAALSLCSPYFDTFSLYNDLSPNLLALSITPHDMGYDFLEEAHVDADIFSDMHAAESTNAAVTFNGVDRSIYPSLNFLKVIDQQKAKVESLKSFDESGNIAAIVKNVAGRNAIKKWGSFDPFAYFPKNSITPQTPSSFNLRDFWAFISLSHEMSKDKYLNQIAASSKEIDSMVSSTTGLHETVNERAKMLQFLNVGRNMNKLALKNIANFFGVTPDKISMAKTGQGELARVMGV